MKSAMQETGAVPTGRFKRDPKPLAAVGAVSADPARTTLRERPREAAVVSWMRSLRDRPARPR